MHRNYTNAGRTVRAVDGISLNIARNEFVAVNGPSGCGKSTLMHLIAGLDQPTSGEIIVDNLALHQASETMLTNYRRKQLGIVFQFFNLLPTMSALENVMFPLLLQKRQHQGAEERAREMLVLVGLEQRANHFPHQLSGGEQQRTAIARALVHRPQLGFSGRGDKCFAHNRRKKAGHTHCCDPQRRYRTDGVTAPNHARW